MKTGLTTLRRHVGAGIMIGLLSCTLIPVGRTANVHGDTSPVSVWWPTQGAHVTGVQPFKAVATSFASDAYRVTWNVDGGSEVQMADSFQDSPHKEALVDLSGWTWDGTGPYKLEFRAYNKSGDLIGSQTTDIYVGAGKVAAAEVTPAPTTTPTPVPVLSAVKTVIKNNALATPASSAQFYAPSSSSALSTAASLASSDPASAAIFARIGSTPTAQWFGGWDANVTGGVDSLTSAAAAVHKTPVLVAYNIPNRDCGSYSAGGASASGYGSWIRAFAAGLKGRPADIILEPDALADVSCLAAGDQAARFAMLADAVNVLEGDTNAKVYLDAGHAGWVDPAAMASRLNQSGIGNADGFSLNVSNFGTTQANTVYGHALSSLLGGKHFVIDTSRNGKGGTADNQWCNPGGQSLGLSPTTATNDSTIDAYLWLKTPGESDGACNGGPSAGTWWPQYALNLAKNAGY